MNEEQLKAALKKYFGFDDFRPGQLATLLALTSGQDALAILPTGAGKTLIYQLLGRLSNGLVVVVSPLISLMQDQVNRLRLAGERRVVMISSLLDLQTQQAVLSHLTEYRFLFLSPELMTSKRVVATLRRCQLSLVVIDEAHCVCEWGPDFRPHYLLLAEALRRLDHPRTLMLTATATPQVADDIVKKLGFNKDEVRVIRRPVDRPNIFLAVDHVENDSAKREELKRLVATYGGRGIVYFSSRKLASQTAQWLSEETGIIAAPYHAGIDAVNRYRIQQQFMNDELQVICATSAFGMGIDKDDVRYVIHYHMPKSLASYVQEIGRAGRNGEQALAVLLYAPGDDQLPLTLNSVELPSDELMAAYQRRQVKAEVLGDSSEVIAFYLDHGVTPQQVRQLFAQRWQTTCRQVGQMTAYAQSNICLREVIAHHFGEQLAEKPAMCCSIDNTDWQQNLHLPVVENKRVNGERLDWQQRLAELFNLSCNS